MPKTGKFNLEELRSLRNTINDQLTDIDIQPKLKKEKALAIAQDRGAAGLTINKLNYLVEQGLVHPHVIPGDRNTHLYGRDEISTVILVHQLKHEKQLRYSQISSLLLDENSVGTNQRKTGGKSSDDVGLPPQGMRAQYILYSRVIAVLMKHLLGEAFQPGLIIFLRKRKAPPNTHLPSGHARILPKWMDLKEADDYVDIVRPKDDLVAFVSPDAEILFAQLDKKTLIEYRKNFWLLVTILIGSPASQYDLLVGTDDPEFRKDVHISTDTFGASIVGTLLKILFANPAEPKQADEVVPSNEFDKSTVLSSLVNFVPEISDLWEYCAVLTSNLDKPNHLQIAAISYDFPKDIRQDIQNILIEPGQPVTGWVYQTNYPMVIQHTSGLLDPRLAYQNKENATAAIAIPTRARNRYNGVLYVGTRYPIPDDLTPFGEAEIRILYIISDIVGEIIERNRITKAFELNSEQIIETPQLDFQTWNFLRKRLTSALQEISAATVNSTENDNLHLTLVRIESHAELYRKDPKISGWLTAHILQTTKSFFSRNGMKDPEIFIHNETVSISQTKEFVCLIPSIDISDGRDREFRNNLRELLSSIKLSFPYDHSLAIETNVWSMPFRRNHLLTRVRNKNVNAIVDELISEVEDALIIIPNIERAHQKEHERAYSAALEEYIEASFLAPNNRYLQRHIAKAYAAIGKLKLSASYWESIIAQEESSSHYLRYAHVLARMGDAEKANDCFGKAYALDGQNAKILVEWGDFLAVECRFQDAVRQYEAALKLDVSDKNQIWLRLAEVCSDQGDTEKALSYVHLVLDRLPDHQDARRLMLKLLKSERGPNVILN